ncbi:MAG: bifunctional diaminohydroxyphosphoribosylaminopyrimidine deaminase/5-amino-6-(5-phosphoribosylamino)uracil reductase RibD [Chloroflexi bacterium]|nr:bifunctional diaminohydroxyphosphoribosylaminopyrimidine deaminase/5-amino-6-(5-phosphoribosylamino)uracil reductase RibD [Chloroflexota bacterium]
MERALDLAEGAAGGLAPRPAVGAVIVARDGETIVGEGATQPTPGPHAEAVALGMAKGESEGGTIYCTLEPHQFRSTTPPCSQAVIDAGIRTVVCPTVDPNPQVAGRGFEHLKSVGIEVINDVDDASQQRADELIEGFAKHVKTGMPFVTVKWAMSLDGKIATRDGDSKWITGSAARAHAHSLRYRSDAVMTGIGTVLADNPRLTARDPNSGEHMCGRPYLRVVVDSTAKMPADAALLEEDGKVIQAVANGEAANRRCEVIMAPSQTEDLVDLAAVMRHLGERGCINVLVEAGERLTGSLFDCGLVDKVVVYVSTGKIIGGSDALSSVGGRGPSAMRDVARLSNVRMEQFGEDIAIIGYVD